MKILMVNNDYMYIHVDFLLFHHLLGELMMNDKSLKIWKILMRFLDLPPWANRSKGLEFTGILLTSFFFVRKHRQQMSGLLLSKRYWMTKVWKSENFWWDFLTCHLEQIALRGLSSPAYFWLLSFLFINNDTNERIASKWDIFFLKFFAAFSFLKLELIALRIFAATGILLTSFFFVCKHRQQMSELL